MELHFTELNGLNKKQVLFNLENKGDDDDNVEEIGIIDDNSNFIPTIIQESLPNVGPFQTIQRQKPILNKPIRINAPVDASVLPTKPPLQPVKKKQISYDDILSSMRMQVGPDGKLQMYSQKLVEANAQQQQELQKKQQQHYLPAVQRQQREEYEFPRQPLTRDQYQQLVTLDLIRRQQEQQRLRQIKSTKLIFPNPNVHITTSPIQGAGANLNRLFRIHK